MKDNDRGKHSRRDRGSRRESREQCFAILFEMTFSDDTVEDILDNAVESRLIVVDDYLRNVLNSFAAHSGEVDSIISANIRGRSLSRLSKTALSILRLAVTELYYTDTPHGAVINEAVELAKKYSEPQAAAYINGVLGTVEKSVETQAAVL